MRLYDTHCHLQDVDFDEDRQQAVERMKAEGVERINLIGCNPVSNQRALDLAQEMEEAYCVVGIHPHDAEHWNEEQRQDIIRKLDSPKCVGIGEIGLDYHYDFHPRDRQIAVLKEQLELVEALQVPVVFHVREAFGDFLPLIRGKQWRGVVHCYAGSWESAKICLDAGLYISFTGSVTFKNADKLREVAKKIPADRIMTETDSPYLAPVPLRGRRNEPSFVAHTARLLAQIRQEDEEEAALRMYKNGCECFNVPFPG